MTKQTPDGAITKIRDIKPGMIVKVKEDPVLHKCLSNDVFSEDGDVDVWGLTLAHEPGMEYYDEGRQGYEKNASYDFAHMDSIEYALPPIPSGYLAVERRDGGIVLIEVAD